jgi:hypothetical protein
MSAALGPYPKAAGQGVLPPIGPAGALQATRVVLLLSLLPASAVAAVGSAASFGALEAGAALAGPALVALVWFALLSPWAPGVLTSRAERRAETALVGAVAVGLALSGEAGVALVLVALHMVVTQALRRLRH